MTTDNFKYKSRFWAISFLLLMISASAQNKEEINPDRHKKDVDNFIAFSNFIEAKRYNFNDFEQLKNIDLQLVWWMPLGSRIQGIKFGGYTSIQFLIVKTGSEIIYLEAGLNSNETKILDSLASINKKLRERMRLWQHEKVKINESIWGVELLYRYKNHKALNRLYRFLDKKYGPKDSVEIKDKEMMKHYRILMYPTYVYPYAGRYGYPPQIPKGRKAMEYLVKHKRFDLLNNVLKGYNPEGKVYAIEALAKENKITAENLKSIRFLVANGGMIQSMVGCLPEYLTYKDIINKIFEEYQINR